MNDRLNETIFFSILIPAYNVAEYLAECIDSIKMQTYGNWEVILVDDGSTDGTGGICDFYSENDSRIKVIHQENQGVAVARNRLLGNAVGDFVIFMDGDDFWCSPHMLDEIAGVINDHKADMVAWWLQIYHNDTGKMEKHTNYIKESEHTVTGKEFMYQVLSGGDFCWWVVLYAFKRNLWEGFKFRPGRKMCEDDEILFKVFLQAKRIWTIEKSYYNYRINRNGSATGCLKLAGLIDSLEVAERNIQYLETSKEIDGLLREILEKHFSKKFLDVGENLYCLKGSDKQKCFNQLKARKWMIKKFRGYGTVKDRIKASIVRIFGIKVGFFVLWVQWKVRSSLINGRKLNRKIFNNSFYQG